MNLYDLSDQFAELDACFEENGGELTPELEARLEALQGTREQKIDGLCYVIRNRQARAEARKAEAERFSKLAKVDQNTADRLKRYLLGWLQFMGTKRVETDTFVVREQTNGRPTVIVGIEDEDLPEQFRLQEWKANVAALREAWEKDPDSLPAGVEVVTGSHLRIQ